MKRTVPNLSLFMLLAGSLSAPAVTEEKLYHQFPVKPGGTLVVEVDFGAIAVSTNASSTVVVEVMRKIGRKKKVDEEAYLSNNPVIFTQEGNTATIRASGQTGSPSLWSGRNVDEAKYTITVPARFSTRLTTGGGSIEMADVTGGALVQTGGGGLTFVRLIGSVNGQTGGGNVKANACTGGLTLRTGGGSLEVTDGSGSLDGRTGGGSVSIRQFQGPAHVGTGGGGLTLEKVEGAVEASTGGGSISATLPSELAEPVKLSTGGGGIVVRAPVSAAFELDASTSGGTVSTDLPVAVVGTIERGWLQGPVNGGGKTVQLRSGGGNIQLKKL